MMLLINKIVLVFTFILLSKVEANISNFDSILEKHGLIRDKTNFQLQEPFKYLESYKNLTGYKELIIQNDNDENWAKACELFYSKSLLKSIGKSCDDWFSTPLKKVSDLLAPFARQRVGTIGENYKKVLDDDGSDYKDVGPNCWNTTLRLHFDGIKEEFTDKKTIDKYLSENFVELQQGDHLEFGDVIVYYLLFEDEMILAHTAFYVGGEFVFHKGGLNKDWPYAFEQFDSTLKYYNIGMLRYKFLRRVSLN